MSGSKFAIWMAKVDRAVEAKVGLSARDLADCSYYDWFEDGVSPAAAAKMAIAENW